MKSCVYYLLLLSLIILISGCNAEMKLVPRDVEFSSFYPASATTGIEPFISLYWGCEYAVSYDLLFGSDPDNLDTIVTALVTPDYYIEPLFLSTTYYWQVIAYNMAGIAFYSPVMSFSTRDPHWQEFYPPAGIENMPLEVFFSWNISRDLTENIQYSFYLGTDSLSLNIMGSGLIDPYIAIDSLFYNTKYYWQVTMNNDTGILNSSQILDFTTKEAEWEIIAPLDEEIELELSVLLQWQLTGSRNEIASTIITPVKSAQTESRTNQREALYLFDVYFGIALDELELLVSGQEPQQFQLSGLSYRQQYFWQVKALYMGEQILESEISSFSTRDRFTEFYPANEEPFIPDAPVLSWDCTDGVLFDVFLGIESGYLNQVASLISENSLPVYNLAYSTIYYWRVDALLTDSSLWTGPELTFITTTDPVPPGYKLVSYLVRAEMPCNIDVVYRVTDMADEPVLIYEDDDFTFLEDDAEIDPVESLLEIYKGDEINSTNKTVLMIDNSTSMDSLLADIKLAAYGFVENMLPNQEMCVFTFSEQTELIEDFTNNQAALIGAINSIESGYSSTNLYGAFITGVEYWDDFYYPENLVKGNLILITDGSDTQGSTTLEEALEARGKHLVYTIGIGSNVDTYALNQLANEEFFHLPTAGMAVTAFSTIQNELTNYLNSFYWLHYITPKRGDFDHALEISLINNPNTGNDAIISDTFNSLNFFGILPGVFVNVDPEAGLPYGIEEYTIADSSMHTLTATSYNYEVEPVYTWEIENADIATLSFVGFGGKYALICAGGLEGTTELTVTDIANNRIRRIDIISEVEIIFPR
ncbi:MAG: VWA domain-containing protein [Candidatus Cloacimonetes bacterium]|nr:VWA domain-containing protein [Candidatus Cloacimonadota bacterium]